MPPKPAARPRRAHHYGISLAHLKFRRRHEHELRVFWHSAAAAEYASRYWAAIPQTDWPKTIASAKGDKRAPFSFVDLDPAGYLAHTQGVLRSVAANSLVSMVTAFEVYLFDVVQRTVFLTPTSVADSGVQISAAAISRAVARPAPRAWFARTMADNYCRNKTHKELIGRVGKMTTSGVINSHSAECDEWSKWVLVRNSVVHLGGEVSDELSASWPLRFPAAGGQLALTATDLNRVAYVARTLVASIDARYVATVTLRNDPMLLARELFVRHDFSNPSALAAQVSRVLGCRFSKNHAAQAIAEQKRGLHEDAGVTFTHGMLGLPEN